VRFLVLLLVACGSTAKPPATPVADKPAAPVLDPACPTGKTFKLADGKLRCRELPLIVDFPPNSEIERFDDDNLTFIRATMDRGVLALFIEPRFSADSDDIAGLRGRLEALVKGIADDAVIVDAQAPAQKDARLATAISFTTPDGGAGIVYAYLAHGWFVAAIAGGRKAETPARPDQPAGKAFLASLQLRPLSTDWAPRKVFDNVELDLPVAAWEQHPETGGNEKATVLYTAVTERTWFGARYITDSPSCALFDGVTDELVPKVVKDMFGGAIEGTGKLANAGKKSLYAETTLPAGTMLLYVVCVDPQVYLVTVTSKRPTSEIKAMIDKVIRRWLPK
jgi:hypothetical protein